MPNCSIARVCIVALLILLTGCSTTVEQLWGFRHYKVPVHITLLQSQHEQLQASITEQQLQDTLQTVNTIWQQAGIAFYIASVTRSPATHQAQYLALFGQAAAPLTPEQYSDALKATCTPKRYITTAINLCITGEFYNGAAGVFFNDDQPKVMWPTLQFGQPYLRPISLAHEFGHALDLRHNTQSKQHLMFAKTPIAGPRFKPSDILLTDDEITHARATALKVITEI